MVKYLDIAIANDSLTPVDIKGKTYMEVNQRIKAFRMCYPTGFIKTNIQELKDGICTMKASVGYYETINNEVIEFELGTGTAQEKEDSNFINKTSYIENCETSAVGRALGMAGFGIDVSVASAEEVQNAIENQKITQKDADTYELKFGKYKGQLLKDVFKTDPKYIDWIINNTQDENMLQIIRLATGLYIPTIEEQKERTELLNKMINELDLDIDELKDKYKVDDLRNLTLEQMKEVVYGHNKQ